MRKKLISRLESIVALKYDRATLTRYSHDQVDDKKYWHEADVVAFPTGTDQVSRVLTFAHRYRIPVTARGAGSGLSGGAIPIQGGILLSFERMNRILEIDEKNFTVTVESGVVTCDLDAMLEGKSLFFAGYPMSGYLSCVGGNVAENAGGGRTIKYGVTADYLLGAEVVTADGTVLRLGGKRIKDVTGYALLKLLCGSEGTLGLFTSLTFRVIPRPRFRAGLLLACERFSSLEKLTTTLKAVGNVLPSALEFMDAKSLTLIEQDIDIDIKDSYTIGCMLVEFDSMEAAELARQLQYGIGRAADCGMKVLVRCEDEAQLEPLWHMRRCISWMTKKRLGSRRAGEDISIAPASISQFMEELDRIERQYCLSFFVFGHAGDGNYHIVPDPNPALSDASWNALHHTIRVQLYLLAERLGGTMSGEHGIGVKQRDYVPLLLSEAEFALYAGIKKTFDPRGILNPGKIFPHATHNMPLHFAKMLQETKKA